jgi:hypothetical protein
MRSVCRQCANHHTTVVLDREPDEADLKEYLFHLTRGTHICLPFSPLSLHTLFGGSALIDARCCRVMQRSGNVTGRLRRVWRRDSDWTTSWCIDSTDTSAFPGT